MRFNNRTFLSESWLFLPAQSMNQHYSRPCAVSQLQAQPQNSEPIKFRLQDLVAYMGQMSVPVV